MANLKSLFKDTAIYGLSSIIGRFLNYLLVPLYTAKLAASSGGYGIITNVYAYVALALVILTFGMETTFFRFANKKEEDPRTVFSTSLIMVGSICALFLLIVFGFLPQIADLMGYAEHPEYIGLMATVVALDSVQAILFAQLRFAGRAIKFATLKLAFIVLNIALNLLYFVALPAIYTSHPEAVSAIYSPSIGVGYAFILNLVCTSGITFLFWNEWREFRWEFNSALIRKMLSYSWPIVLLGIAGILNQTADKILFPFIYEGGDSSVQLGIYGAASKIAMIMAMITQAFRYAYEPFVFKEDRNGKSDSAQASAMKYFILFTLLAFLCVMAYIDVLRYIIAPDYWEGLKVVPIVMMAEIMMGVYFNLSFWYKLTDRTIWGAILSGTGCAVLIAINVIFVPVYGYTACAWAGVAGYGTAMVFSYIMSRRYRPINYPLKSIALYVALTAVLYAAMTVQFSSMWLTTAYRTALLLVFVAVMFRCEHMGKMLAKAPVIGRCFKS